ncbi:hypothetical protein CRE_16005 [Caenorhabditis remanei]|uniref:Receptor L-domain domain-containing protein n=1 Tax=Caenorhabditis remanei TaxID=31234 RepID=E3MBA9_CAERE|nr:hypothetical protein CRE_16005 [Caenorhabditis remanei]
MEQFPKTCSTVCSELLINENCDLSEDQLTSLFSNMKKLIGSLTVISTKYTSGKFLSGMESIECVDGSEIMWILNNQMLELGLVKLTTINCKGITVTGNKRLEKLNMPNIKNMTHPTNSNKKVGVSISSDLPSFCITTQEMYNFMIIDTAEVDYIFAKYCSPVTGGTHLFGSVEIGPNDYLESMKSVETIFGSLVIRGTDLTDFGFLENLRYVAQLEHKPAILIENNSKLTNVTFPNLKRIRSHTADVLKFDLNNREISTNSSLCYELRKSLSLSDFAPTFDGFACEILEFMEKQVKDTKNDAGSLSLIPAVIFLFLKL